MNEKEFLEKYIRTAVKNSSIGQEHYSKYNVKRGLWKDSKNTKLEAELLEEKNSSRAVSANVDFYSGFDYSMLNIPTDLYTPIFAVARIPGWCAHRFEEILVGGRIIRPAYKAVSQKEQYISMNKR